MAEVVDQSGFLDDAPWDKCEHSNYEYKCVGCWEALVGQAKKADTWRQALEDVRSVVRELRAEIATLTPKKRDDRQVFLLEQADDVIRRLFR